MSDEVRVYTREQGTTRFSGPKKEDRARMFAMHHYVRTGDESIVVTRVQETEMMNIDDIRSALRRED